MNLFFGVLTDLFHFLKIILICNMFLVFKKRIGKLKYLISAEIAVLISIGIYVYDNDLLEMIIYSMIMCIIMYILYQEKFYVIAISAVWIILITSMLDIMFTVFVQVWFELFGIKFSTIEELCAAILSIIFVFIVGSIYIGKYKVGVKNIGFSNLGFLTFLMAADTFVIMSMAIITVNETQERYRLLYSIAFIMVIMGIFIQLSTVILLFVSRNLSRENEYITKKYLSEQKNHYEYLEKRERETKKFRHDLRSHMEMLSALALNKEYEEFNNYLETINIKIDSFGNIISLGNGIVDAIVNKYYLEALQNGIQMIIKGAFPRECEIEAYDLCTIFSNVLSNALEAAVQSSEKRITLNCRYTCKNIIVVIRNTFIDVGQFQSDKIKTNKKDVNYHGFGLENIRDCVEKNQGFLDIEVQNSEFIVTISLKCPEKRDYEGCSR